MTPSTHVAHVNGHSCPPKQQGLAAIEFVFVMTIFLMLLVGVVGFGAMFWMQQKLSDTAGDGARAALYGRAEGVTNLTAAACAPVIAAFAGDPGISCNLTQQSCAWPSSNGLTYTCGAVVISYDVSSWAPLAALRALIAVIPLPSTQKNWIPTQLGAQANVQIWQEAGS
jgi:Flp pilus assembly protein TadG